MTIKKDLKLIFADGTSQVFRNVVGADLEAERFHLSGVKAFMTKLTPANPIIRVETIDESIH